MTLSKAIEIIETMLDIYRSPFTLIRIEALRYEALQLGIEALKRVKKARAIIRAPNEDFLPGETEV